MSQVRKPKRLAARSFRLFLASSDNARPSRKSSLSLKSFMRSIAFRLHSRKFVMYEFRCAKEHAIARTFHKAFQLVETCLLLGLMEGLMKGSSYCVFLCAAEFIHDEFPRVKTECNRAHEGLQRKRRLPARARIVRRCQEQAERSSGQPLRFTYL